MRTLAKPARLVRAWAALGSLPQPSRSLLPAAMALLCALLLAGGALAAEQDEFVQELADRIAQRVVLSPAERQWLAQEHRVRVRVGEVPPHHFTFHGTPRGLSIDYLRVIFAAFAINHEFLSQAGGTFPEALENLASGNMVDVLPTLRRTPEREGRMLFSSDYVFTPWAIFTRVDSPFVGGLADLRGKTVAVEAGFLLARKLAHDHPAIRIVEFADSRHALEALALGQADAYVGDLSIGTFAIQIYGFTDVKVAAPTEYLPVAQAVAVRPDWPELVSIVNKSLAALTPEETRQIINHTFSIRFEHRVDWRMVQWAFAVAALLALVVFLLWNRRLTWEIHERKQAEKALTISEQRFREIFDKCPLGVLVADVETRRFIMVNHQVARMLGYAEEELLTLAVDAIHPPEDMAVVAATFAKLTPGGNIESPPVRVVRKDGSVLDVVVNAALVEVAGRTGALGFFTDITERKRAEVTLMENEERFRLLVEQAPEAIVVSDAADLGTVMVNRNAEVLFATSRQDLLENGFFRFYASRQPDGMGLEESIAQHQARVMAGETVNVFERMIRNAAGKDLLCEVRLVRFLLGGRETIRASWTDITERKRMQEVIVQTEKMMSIGGLAAGMAHEINNPLAAILQSTQVMMNRLSPEVEANREAAAESGCTLECIHAYMRARGISGFLESIREAGGRAARIVANMLEFSRRGEPRHGAVDIASLLDKTVELAASDYDLKKSYDFKQIAIRRDYADNLPAIHCSQTEIEQVILNLLKNAAQAMAGKPRVDARPTITLRTYPAGESVAVEVADNGPGMDEAVRKRIFEPFYTTKIPGEGTGLGLSVSYFIIVDNHKGTFEVESAPGKGTRFIVRLPAEPAAAAVDAGDSPPV